MGSVLTSAEHFRFWVVSEGRQQNFLRNWRQIKEMQLRKTSDEGEGLGSLESLCQVWKHSRDEHPPYICRILNINESGSKSYNSSEASWQPLSQAVDSFATNRNIGISTVLVCIFSILLIIAIYLKYRKKTEVDPDPIELDNLTRECSSGGNRCQDVPPDYHAVVMNSLYDDSLPDYEDDVVKKVML